MDTLQRSLQMTRNDPKYRRNVGHLPSPRRSKKKSWYELCLN